MKVKALAVSLTLGLLIAPMIATADTEEDAKAEYDRALRLEPNLENGKEVYRICVVCHGPEGWGRADGYYPQIAGQLRSVVIKQLADIRARNRDNPTMYPFTVPRLLGGVQEIADVAAYISELPMMPHVSAGPGFELEHGRKLYEDNCVECHGEQGEGDVEDHAPLIRGQHFRYLVRQFEWIKNGRRRNADSQMVKQIKGFSPRDIRAVMDYVSRIGAPADKKAEPGWQNPDFPHYARPVPPPIPPAPSL